MRSVVRHEAVADPPDGLDVAWLLRIVVQLLTQATDEDLDVMDIGNYSA